MKFADGHSEHYDFAALSDLTGRFANWLARRGIAQGDRVAVIVDPSRAFYVGMFGAMKYGAIAVPLCSRCSGRRAWRCASTTARRG